MATFAVDVLRAEAIQRFESEASEDTGEQMGDEAGNESERQDDPPRCLLA